MTATRRMLAAALIVLATLLPTAGPALAAGFAEIGDAGNLPATAQQPAGAGSLDSIAGTLTGPPDQDLFRVCLTGGETFSASTVGTPGTVSDTQLFLFDRNGIGVLANDDEPGGVSLRSRLPLGAGPAAGGVYYLGITAFNDDPASNVPASGDGLIFPSFPFRDVHGPTGPGGGSPLSSWTGSSGSAGTYTIELTGTVFCTPDAVCSAVPPAPPGAIVGTAGADTLVGTAGPDVIYGRGGNDTIAGLGGNDIIFGGPGADRIAGGDGNDLICGEAGNDDLAGESGNDLVAGGDGHDRLSGDGGNDHLFGGPGADQLAGGPGTDTCRTGGNPGDVGDASTCESLSA